MEGRTVLVTGANTGIGREVSRRLAAKGATVVMSARDKHQAETARDDIIAKTGNSEVHLLLADLSSFQQVVKLTEKFRAQFDNLYALVNNAGIFLTEYTETQDGIETQWMVNHLAPYLLTRRLIDLLKSTPDSRIINVSSNAHRNVNINFDDLNGKQGYDGFRAYSQAKLANILFAKELATRLNGTGVSSFAVHPGVVRTSIGDRNNNSWIGWLWRLGKPFMIPISKGADTIVYLASSSGLSNLSGQYFIKRKPSSSSKHSMDPEQASHLWQVSEKSVRKYL